MACNKTIKIDWSNLSNLKIASDHLKLIHYEPIKSSTFSNMMQVKAKNSEGVVITYWVFKDCGHWRVQHNDDFMDVVNINFKENLRSNETMNCPARLSKLNFTNVDMLMPRSMVSNIDLSEIKVLWIGYKDTADKNQLAVTIKDGDSGLINYCVHPCGHFRNDHQDHPLDIIYKMQPIKYSTGASTIPCENIVKDSPIKPITDDINQPTHYNSLGAICKNCKQPISTHDVIKHFSNDAGNVIKYVWRHKYKGQPLKDLKKARWYLNALIEELENVKTS